MRSRTPAIARPARRRTPVRSRGRRSPFHPARAPTYSPAARRAGAFGRGPGSARRLAAQDSFPAGARRNSRRPGRREGQTGSRPEDRPEDRLEGRPEGRPEDRFWDRFGDRSVAHCVGQVGRPRERPRFLASRRADTPGVVLVLPRRGGRRDCLSPRRRRTRPTAPSRGRWRRRWRAGVALRRSFSILIRRSSVTIGRRA